MQPHQAVAAQPTKPKRVFINSQPIEAARIDSALLKLKTACQLGGFSESTLRRLEATDPTFPRFIKLGARCTRVHAGSFTAWLASKAGA